jgi:hypothetical protein
MPPVTAKKPAQDKLVADLVVGLHSKMAAVVVQAAGDVLRRSARCGAELVAEADEALAALSTADVRAVVSAIDVEGCRRSVERAGAEAFEAAFAESPEEREVFATSAHDALLARDRAESSLAAGRRRAATADAAAKAELEAILGERSSALRSLDATFGGSVGRSLTAITDRRRASHADLDESSRATAPWFASFADADDMLAGLAGVKTTELSASTRAALEASSLPGFVHRRDETSWADAESSALCRVSLGDATPAERAFLEARAKGDAALAKDLAEAAADVSGAEG